MATFTRRTVTVTRKEWIVPAAEPWGAFLGDIHAAIAAAGHAYRGDHNLPETVVLPDDALRFTTTDDAIVIRYTLETEAEL